MPTHKACSLIVLIVVGCSTRTELQTERSRDGEIARQLAEVICAGNGVCCVTGSSSTCVADIERELLAGAESVRAAGATFDAANAERCLASLPNTFKGCPTFKTFALPRECAHIYVGGGIANDQPCIPASWFNACADPEALCMTKASTSGTDSRCQRVEYVGAGERCGLRSGTLIECSGGLACLPDPAHATNVCQPRKLLGEPCNGAVGDDCVEGAVCDRRFDGGRGVCVEPVAHGGACSRPEQCEIYNCVSGRCFSSITLSHVCAN